MLACVGGKPLAGDNPTLISSYRTAYFRNVVNALNRAMITVNEDNRWGRREYPQEVHLKDMIGLAASRLIENANENLPRERFRNFLESITTVEEPNWSWVDAQSFIAFIRARNKAGDHINPLYKTVFHELTHARLRIVRDDECHSLLEGPAPATVSAG